MAEPTEEEILAQQLAHLDKEGDRIGDPLGLLEEEDHG